MPSLDVVDIIRRYSRVGPVLGRRALVCVCLFGVSAAAFISQFLTADRLLPENKPFPWFLWALTILPIILLPAVWFFLTRLYYWLGSSPKIGVAYDGHQVNIDDWIRTADTLRSMFSERRLSRPVVLRFVSLTIANHELRATRFMKRYGFDLLALVQSSPSADPGPKGSSEAQQDRYFLRLAPPTDPRLLVSSAQGALRLLLQKQSGTSKIDLLNTKARNLHDIMLYYVALQLYTKKKHHDAQVILGHLDNCLEKRRYTTKDSPRKEVRMLDMVSRMHRVQLPIKSLPDKDVLDEIAENASGAEKYISEFPAMAIDLARLYYLAGDADGAWRVVNKALQCNVSGKVLALLQLGRAFLAFTMTYWDAALKSYEKMLSIPDHRTTNWQDLVDFIDHVAEFQYDGICVLQVFYRRLAGQHAPHALCTAANEWIGADSSRAALGKLLQVRVAARKPQENSSRPRSRQRRSGRRHKYRR